ncbi:MAG TPA: hypothetical protein VF857_11070, partial [Spirochaetota bacterium]
KYQETDLITAGKLRYLPIPLGKENYAFLQSVGKVSNIVVGFFKEGEHRIVWISDENGDGTVDTGAIYFPDTGKIARIQNLGTEYSPETFKKMKLEIITSEKSDLTLNPEGSIYLKKIIESKSNLVKKIRFKNGYRAFVNDPDDPNNHRVIFYYSNNEKAEGGSDLAFEVRFHNNGSQMIRPVITYNVYCKDSVDPVVIDVVNDLTQFTKKNFGE